MDQKEYEAWCRAAHMSYKGPLPSPVQPGADLPKSDFVNHPPHYTQHPSGVECIQITEHMNFCIGNAMKYLWRADLKGGLQDLEKARWYIDREIARRTKT